MNLAANARDAMPQGGTLTLATADVDLDEAQGRSGLEVPPGPYVMLAVSDTGCGMDEATEAHLFEPFFTTQEPGKGTGLGLATVYGIVRQSGGAIAVATQVGQGTTFRIYLPRVAETEVAAPPPEPPGLPQGTETVLVVEDERAVRELIRQVLLQIGYTVLVARGGAEGQALSEQHAGPIHLLLTDVIMPGMSGPQLVQRLLLS